MVYKSIGKSIKDKANFAYSSLLEAAKEYGIPTKGSYWKKHPGTALLTTGLVATGTTVGASDLYVLTDPNSSSKILSNGTVREDVSFFPPHRHNNSPTGDFDERAIGNRKLGWGDYLSLAAPLILVGASIVLNVHNYGKWKKSIEEVKKESKTWPE